MATKKNKKTEPTPVIHVPRNATMKEIYAILKREFTAADLQRFTEVGPTVSGRKLLADLEAIHRTETRKRRKK